MLSRLMGRGGFFIGVYLIDNATMKKLNRKYGHRNKVTNVLAFETPKEFLKIKTKFGEVGSLGAKNRDIWEIQPRGEIYLAPDYIKQKQENAPALLVHGFLHLLGFDHKKKGDRIKMEKLENKLFHKIKNQKQKIKN